MQIESNGPVAKAVISVGESIITAIIIDGAHDDLRVGIDCGIAVLFKESETAIACLLPPGMVSIRNRLLCSVVSVNDDGLLASIVLDFNGSSIESLITSESASELCLGPGKNVFALIKSTEVMIEKEMP